MSNAYQPDNDFPALPESLPPTGRPPAYMSNPYAVQDLPKQRPDSPGQSDVPAQGDDNRQEDDASQNDPSPSLHQLPAAISYAQAAGGQTWNIGGRRISQETSSEDNHSQKSKTNLQQEIVNQSSDSSQPQVQSESSSDQAFNPDCQQEHAYDEQNEENVEEEDVEQKYNEEPQVHQEQVQSDRTFNNPPPVPAQNPHPESQVAIDFRNSIVQSNHAITSVFPKLNTLALNARYLKKEITNDKGFVGYVKRQITDIEKKLNEVIEILRETREPHVKGGPRVTEPLIDRTVMNCPFPMFTAPQFTSNSYVPIQAPANIPMPSMSLDPFKELFGSEIPCLPVSNQPSTSGPPPVNTNIPYKNSSEYAQIPLLMPQVKEFIDENVIMKVQLEHYLECQMAVRRNPGFGVNKEAIMQFLNTESTKFQKTDSKTTFLYARIINRTSLFYEFVKELYESYSRIIDEDVNMLLKAKNPMKAVNYANKISSFMETCLVYGLQRHIFVQTAPEEKLYPALNLSDYEKQLRNARNQINASNLLNYDQQDRFNQNQTYWGTLRRPNRYARYNYLCYQLFRNIAQIERGQSANFGPNAFFVLNFDFAYLFALSSEEFPNSQIKYFDIFFKNYEGMTPVTPETLSSPKPLYPFPWVSQTAH